LSGCERRGNGLFERDDAHACQRQRIAIRRGVSARAQNDLGMPNTCSPKYERIRFVEMGAT
jgi:hypothetical protein